MIIRLIKFFKKENELMPELMSVDQNKISAPISSIMNRYVRMK